MKLSGPSILFSVLLLAPLSVSAAAPGLFDDWKTADGSVVRTFPCAGALCIKVVSVTPTAPGTLDRNNPNSALRNRSICNLQIGSGFRIDGANRATGGRLYDPQSGKTYKGDIDLQGNLLKLRGYVGIALFGRTETWRRSPPAKPCKS